MNNLNSLKDFNSFFGNENKLSNYQLDKCKINYFSLLPEELLRHIFSFLSHLDIKKCSCVCKLWNKNCVQIKLQFELKEMEKKLNEMLTEHCIEQLDKKGTLEIVNTDKQLSQKQYVRLHSKQDAMDVLDTILERGIWLEELAEKSKDLTFQSKVFMKRTESDSYHLSSYVRITAFLVTCIAAFWLYCNQ